MTKDRTAHLRRITFSVLLSLTLPALLFAATAPKPRPQALPLPGEESLVPLLGDPEPIKSLWKADISSGDPTLPPSVCSLAQCDPQSCPLGPNRACLLQTFQDVQWRLCVYASQFGSASNQSNKGLEIGQVYLRRLFIPNDPWQQILHRAGLADLFTVYHAGSDPGFYETQFLNNWSLGRRTVTAADAGANGALITLAQDAALGPTVVAECRDRGLAWMCKQSSSISRRGPL